MPGLLWLSAKHIAAWTGLVAPIWALLADTKLFDPHTMVGLVGPLLVIAVAGFFTVRSNVAKIWRENYEAEAERTKIAQDEAKEQRELKHQALGEVAALRLELTAERSKPDLSTLSAKLDRLLENIDAFERR